LAQRGKGKSSVSEVNMAAMWFFLDGEQRQGPFTADELVKVLLGNSRPHNVPIWREGLPGWPAAGSVPEIREALPPSESSAQLSNDVHFGDAEEIAKFYRLLVLLVGFQILLGFFLQLPGEIAAPPESGVFALVVSLAAIGLLAATAFTAYHLTRRLGEGLPILWAIAMFVPCINIIGLLIISTKAQAWCRRHGIKVGFFGPTKESIEELRRRAAASNLK
jgi:hypothetical protein